MKTDVRVEMPREYKLTPEEFETIKKIAVDIGQYFDDGKGQYSPKLVNCALWLALVTVYDDKKDGHFADFICEAIRAWGTFQEKPFEKMVIAGAADLPTQLTKPKAQA